MSIGSGIKVIKTAAKKTFFSEKQAEEIIMEKFAVIDTETNWNDDVMSIGAVVAESESMKEIDSIYYIIDPEYRVGGMYSNALQFDEKKACVTNRRQALKEIKEWLKYYEISYSFENTAF